MKEALIGQASPEQIEAWKKEHKDVFAIEVDGHVGYFKKPTRQVIAAAMNKLKTNQIEYAETILENCFIGGSRALIEDDGLFLSTLEVVDKLIEVKQSELVKL